MNGVTAQADVGLPKSRQGLRALLRPDLRGVWVVLVATTLLSALRFGPHQRLSSFGIFPRAARIFLSPGSAGGFHLYHVRPDYQFGPVATLVSLPLAPFPLHISKVVMAVLMTVVGLGLVGVVTGVVPDGIAAVRRVPLLVGGLLVMPVWVSLSVRSGHLDDVLTLGFGVLGVLQVRRGNAVGAAVLLALAVDSKPWALGFGVALLALPRAMWRRSVLVWSGVIAVAWLPFFIVEPRTVDALRFRLRITDGSLLRLIHPAGGLIPGWVRPSQLLLAVVVGCVVVRAGAVPATLLATVAARILLDPEIADYYTAGAALVALLADRTTGRRVPWFALSVVCLLWLPSLVPHSAVWDGVAKGTRLVWSVGTLLGLVALALPRRDPQASLEPAPSQG